MSYQDIARKGMNEQAAAFRQIAASLGMEGAEPEKVVEWVKKLDAVTLLMNNEVSEWCPDESTKGR